MLWLASFSIPEFCNKLTTSFPANLDDTNWWDWGWFLLFAFLGSPLMKQIWNSPSKGRKEALGVFVLTIFFFGGWSLVGYFTR